MAKEISSQQRALNRSARQAAKAAGKNWSELSKEDRKSFRKAAHAEIGKRRVNPNVMNARRAAEAAGKEWSALSQAERKAYLEQARGPKG